MTDGYAKPGDRVYRPRRIKRFRTRRALGVIALFSAGYGDVGSSIYYGLGIVALAALGATPIALAVAGLIYILNTLTYAEGSAMLPEAGGAASFARHGFNDLVGFIGGWAVMLSYVAAMSIAAYTIPPYLSYFWPVLQQPVAGTLASMAIIVFLMVINVLGLRESPQFNFLFVSLDIAIQLSLVGLGLFLILRPDPGRLFQHMFGSGNWPSAQDLLFGIAIGALCFTGVETVSQLAEETHRPTRKIPQAYILMVMAVLVMFAGVSLVALTAMTPQVLGDPINGFGRDPVAGIAANLPRADLRRIFSPLVAALVAIILLNATNAGLNGISRLAYNLSTHRQLPQRLNRIHRRFRTPYIAIILFGSVALFFLLRGFFTPTFFADLGGLYVFGSLLGFALAHTSILALRIRKPDTFRPFRLPLNIRVAGRLLPVTAVLGMLSTVGIWLVILFTNAYSRWVGLTWMAAGVVIYCIYRRMMHVPLTRSSTRRAGK